MILLREYNHVNSENQTISAMPKNPKEGLPSLGYSLSNYPSLIASAPPNCWLDPQLTKPTLGQYH